MWNIVKDAVEADNEELLDSTLTYLQDSWNVSDVQLKELVTRYVEGRALLSYARSDAVKALLIKAGAQEGEGGARRIKRRGVSRRKRATRRATQRR